MRRIDTRTGSSGPLPRTGAGSQSAISRRLGGWLGLAMVLAGAGAGLWFKRDDIGNAVIMAGADAWRSDLRDFAARAA